MKKILIATHGHLADGYKSSLSILAGRQDQVCYVNAYVDDSDYTQAIRAFIDSVGSDDEGVIFTDLHGGSVCQRVALERPGLDGVFHITGANLALVIEVLLTDEKITREYLTSAIEVARSCMRLIEEDVSQVSTEESPEDFFD